MSSLFHVRISRDIHHHNHKDADVGFTAVVQYALWTLHDFRPGLVVASDSQHQA